jgi:two-component system, LytTR family, sensor kinase
MRFLTKNSINTPISKWQYHFVFWHLYLILIHRVSYNVRGDNTVIGWFVDFYSRNILLITLAVYAQFLLLFRFRGNLFKQILASILNFSLFLLLRETQIAILKFSDIVPHGISNGNHLRSAPISWFFFGGVGVCLFLAFNAIEKQSKILNLEKDQLQRDLEIENEKKRSAQLIMENQRAELDKLKAQINPHFLFNTLNFFYSEIRPLSPKTADSVILLSDILRYSLASHKTDDLVSVTGEIEYLKNYIQFQRNRFYDNFYLALNIDVEEGISDRKIPSLMLITLVENCFKYADLNDEANPCEIIIEVNAEMFLFKTKNKIHDNPIQLPSTGIGLANIKNRLEIIYGHDNFQFQTKKEGVFFYCDLSIQ